MIVTVFWLWLYNGSASGVMVPGPYYTAEACEQAAADWRTGGGASYTRTRCIIGQEYRR